MSKSIAILNSQAPFSFTSGKDALDLALIFGSYEQQVSLFFQGQGVFQLIENNNADLLETKDYLKTLAALEFYDIEQVYVCQQSLDERQLAYNFHIDSVVVLNQKEFTDKLNQHQILLRF